MDKIVVPQFLDVESTIIGPVTVRQFVEVLAASLVIFIFYKIFDFSLFVFASLAVAAITLVLAFIKVNGQPFHHFLLNFFVTLKNPKIKVWRKSFSAVEIKAAAKKRPLGRTVAVKSAPAKIVTSSKLSELALVVDTGGVYQGENTEVKK